MVVLPEVLVAASRLVYLMDRPGRLEESEEIRQVVKAYGKAEVARALLVIVGELLEIMSACMPPEPSEDDALSTLFPPLMRKVQSTFPELPTTTWPTLAAVLTAALTGQDAARWWSDCRSHSAIECDLFAFVCLLWLVGDLYEYTSPGEFERTVAQIVANPLDH